jgi:rhamnosyltransferase
LNSEIAVVVPTLNASRHWANLTSLLAAAVPPEFVLIIDSSSNDGTPDLAREAGFQVHSIAREDFDHGATRQLALDLRPNAEIVIFLTQDAQLASADAIAKLLEVFSDLRIAAAYGRQLPRLQATPIEAHARHFNYPPVSKIKNLPDRKGLGIKTIFISNSFAAYRRSALMAVGGFPRNVIFGEDTIIAGKLVLGGWKIAYVAAAEVYHSHAYTWRQDFRRYFDIGVLHARESWMLEEFGRAGGEGGRFVRSEIRYLWREGRWYLPSAFVRTGLKFLAYRLGKNESRLPSELKRYMSLHPEFWT